jgi:hypothetical protein
MPSPLGAHTQEQVGHGDHYQQHEAGEDHKRRAVAGDQGIVHRAGERRSHGGRDCRPDGCADPWGALSRSRGLQQGFDGLLLIRSAHVMLSGVLSGYG